MNSVSCAVGVKQMPADIVQSEAVTMRELEQISFNLISISSPVPYRRMCIYILMQTVHQYPNTGEAMLCHILSLRYGYTEEFVRSCLRAVSNIHGTYALRCWSNRALRKASERFYVAHKNYDRYKEHLESLHPEFCKLNVVWPQLEKGK